jgi:mRNA interferase MazF
VLPKVRFLVKESIANVQGIGSLPNIRLERKLGKLPDEVLVKIKKAILFAIDIDG